MPKWGTKQLDRSDFRGFWTLTDVIEAETDRGDFVFTPELRSADPSELLVVVP